MTKDWGNADERRRYFRVADQLLIGYSVVPEEEMPAKIRHSPDITAIGKLDNLIAESLSRVRVQNPSVAEVLELFNRKINLTLSLDEKRLQTISAVEKGVKEVNLSACGIAFPVLDALSIGCQLHLDITLLPSYINLSVEAQVIACAKHQHPEDGDDYLVRVDFLNLSDVDQELLVQHVIKCQTQELKARREARESE